MASLCLGVSLALADPHSSGLPPIGLRHYGPHTKVIPHELSHQGYGRVEFSRVEDEAAHEGTTSPSQSAPQIYSQGPDRHRETVYHNYRACR